MDVRKKSEFDSQHIINDRVINAPLDYFDNEVEGLDVNKTYYVHCAGGYRSVIASSILKHKGFKKVYNLDGGFKALKETKLSVSEYHEQVTML